MTLEQQLEGVLFYKAAPVKKPELMRLLDVSDESLTAALQRLAEHLKQGGTRLLETTNEVQLVTAQELDELIDGMRKDELKRDIGKAGAETLAIILYRGPIGRAEIDRIRGVNSAFILRNLLVRGLIERDQAGRSYTFQTTPALLAHLGVTQVTDLPDYEQVLNQLEAFEAEQEAAETEQTS